MIALLKYGSGMPFYRLEKLEHLLGIPLSASAQWEIAEEAAEVIKAAPDDRARKPAKGDVRHMNDTEMAVRRRAPEPSVDQTAGFPSGIVPPNRGKRFH